MYPLDRKLAMTPDSRTSHPSASKVCLQQSEYEISGHESVQTTLNLFINLGKFLRRREYEEHRGSNEMQILRRNRMLWRKMDHGSVSTIMESLLVAAICVSTASLKSIEYGSQWSSTTSQMSPKTCPMINSYLNYHQDTVSSSMSCSEI